MSCQINANVIGTSCKISQLKFSNSWLKWMMMNFEIWLKANEFVDTNNSLTLSECYPTFVSGLWEGFIMNYKCFNILSFTVIIIIIMITKRYVKLKVWKIKMILL